MEGRLAAELPGLRAFLRRLVAGGDPSLDPEDLLQEVSARALRYRHSHDPSRPLGPWLRAIAFRVYLDALGGLRRRPERAGASFPEPSDPRAQAPGTALERREELQSLLARLPDRERQVLSLFYLEGSSVRAIARRWGLAEGSVKSLLHRARRHLAREREEEPE